MKYGVPLNNLGAYASAMPLYNMGDSAKAFAILNAYKALGVPDSAIAFIDVCDLQTYDKEYVLFPLSTINQGTCIPPIPYSPKIIPVPIGMTFASKNLEDSALDYLRRIEPVGCRDEYSLHYLRAQGVRAYLSGCMTMTLPQRTNQPTSPKIFLIDVPQSLIPFIPPHIMQHAEYVTHAVDLADRPMRREEAIECHRRGMELFQRYEDEATLIVSSRLHGVAPSLARGIPVIFATENISHRFSWIDRYVPVYTPDMFHEIDWSPSVVEYSAYKSKIIELFFSQINRVREQYDLMYEVSEWYENRTKSRYASHYYDIASSLKGKVAEDFKYVIWGCGLTGESLWEVLQELFPHARLVAAIDEFQADTMKSFHGAPVFTSDALVDYSDAFVFLATNTGKVMGRSVLKRLGREEGTHFLDVGTTSG